VKAGTDIAFDIKRKWEQRQMELKEAMSTMVKPAEHMAKLAQILINSTADVDTLISTLTELESLVTDVDNARDFHTIGAWQILLKMLYSHQNQDKIIMHVAWTIGTVVKNNYDYQLWLLEDVETVPSAGNRSANCLNMLVRCLSSETNYTQETQRRILYAISSGARGNADIQEALLATKVFLVNSEGDDNVSSFLELFYELADRSQRDSTVEISRKIWALVSDMLDERQYIRQELLQIVSGDLSESARASVDEEISTLSLLGDRFCASEWATLAKVQLDHFSRLTVTKEDIPSWNALVGNLVTCLQSMAQQCPQHLNDADLVQLKSRVWTDLGWADVSINGEVANASITAS